MALGLLALGGLAMSGIGAGIQAFQNKKASKEAESAYNQQRGALLTDMYSNPYDSISTKSLLSRADRRLDKQLEAIENQATAGGATFENALAAKQAGNDTMADLEGSIIQGETARQAGLKNQLLNLDAQRSAQKIAEIKQSGANWAGLFNNLAGSVNTLGGTMLENEIPLKDLFKVS